MASRFPILAALMAFAATLAGCGEESPPTAPQTVQLQLVAAPSTAALRTRRS